MEGEDETKRDAQRKKYLHRYEQARDERDLEECCRMKREDKRRAAKAKNRANKR